MTKKIIKSSEGVYGREIITQGEVTVVIFSDEEDSEYMVQSNFEEIQKLPLSEIDNNGPVLWLCRGSKRVGRPVFLVAPDASNWINCESLGS